MLSTYLTLLVVFILTVVYLIFVASLLKQVVKVNLGYLVVFLWGVLIVGLFFCDYFQIPTYIVGLIGLLSQVAMHYVLVKKYRVSLASISIKEALFAFAIWCIAGLVITIPFILLPKDTVISGHFISNDSVMHAIMSQGFQNTRSTDLADYYNNSYPRGIHSVIYYLSEAINIDPAYLLLGFTIFTLSLLAFSVYQITKSMGVNGKLSTLLLVSLAISPFLLVNTVYNLFIPQIAVIPLLSSALFYIVCADFRRLNLFDIGSVLLLVLAVFSVYGIFPIPIIALGILMKLAEFIRQGNKLNFRVNIKWVALLIGLIVLSIPSLVLTYNILLAQIIGGTGSNLLNSWGNLPGGFLSVFHLSGLWVSDLEYRGDLVGVKSGLSHLFLVVLATQFILIYKSKRRLAAVMAIISLGLPCVLIIIITGNPYLHFKYYTFLIPIFLLLAGTSLVSLNFRSKLLLNISVLVFAGLCIMLPLKNYRNSPVVRDFQLKEIEFINNNYIEQGSTLILSREDWFAYYRDESNDFIPLTQYVTRDYDGSELDFIVWDKGYENDIKTYSSTNIEVQAIINNVSSECVVNPFERYIVYELDCD